MHLGVRDATNVFLLKPDITVWKIDQNGTHLGIDRVVDAKWKHLDPYVPDYGVNEGDVYQLLAYASRYGCTNLELAYPMPDGEKAQLAPPTFKISSSVNDLSKALEIKIKLVSIG